MGTTTRSTLVLMNIPFTKLFKKSEGADERIEALEKVIEHELGRVDKLAQERTLLANERTMLAYQRTSISLFLLAVALVQFTNDPLLERLGILVFFLGVGLIVFGLVHFQTRQRRIRRY